MRLSAEEQAWLDGSDGEAHAVAMELVVAAGEICNAPRLRPIQAAYVNTTFSAAPSHLDFLERIVEGDGRVAVPTFSNVAGTGPGDQRRGPDAAQLAQDTARLSELHKQIGARPSYTCAPYLLPQPPGFGVHVACSESNAVSYFNSVLGARTAKYGDYLDLAAALTGRVPEAGLHTDEGCAPQIVMDIDVSDEAFANSDLTATLLGLCMGDLAGIQVVLIEGLPNTLPRDELRAIAAGGATWGGVAMFHATGLTPEAEYAQTQSKGLTRHRVTAAELEAARTRISAFDSGHIDAVVIGTPHASVREVRAVIGFLDGRPVATSTAMYLQLNRFTATLLETDRSVNALRRAGVQIVQDTCLYWQPTAQGLSGRVMTSSGKFAHYANGELGLECCLASLKVCVDSAVSGSVSQ